MFSVFAKQTAIGIIRGWFVSLTGTTHQIRQFWPNPKLKDECQGLVSYQEAEQLSGSQSALLYQKVCYLDTTHKNHPLKKKSQELPVIYPTTHRRFGSRWPRPLHRSCLLLLLLLLPPLVLLHHRAPGRAARLGLLLLLE